MAKPKKAGLLLLGLGGMKPKDDEEEDSESSKSEDDETSAKKEAAQALIDAIKDDDAEGVAEAFAILRDCCEED